MNLWPKSSIFKDPICTCWGTFAKATESEGWRPYQNIQRTFLNEKASFICILVCQERLVAWECVGFKCCRHVCSWHYLMGNQLKTISSNIFLWSWWISLTSILGSMQDQLIGVHNASECMLVTTSFEFDCWCRVLHVTLQTWLRRREKNTDKDAVPVGDLVAPQVQADSKDEAFLMRDTGSLKGGQGRQSCGYGMIWVIICSMG